RLVPVIRHLTSSPAGLARMNSWKFLLFTTIGAGGWHSVLAAMGWYLHAIVPEDQLNDKISEYAEYIKIVIIGLVILAIIYFILKSRLKKKNGKNV
ncbi:MAG: DedA family protein, partial [Prevotella sp.]|nr:DedA family protein [Prevotella sp.]